MREARLCKIGTVRFPRGCRASGEPLQGPCVALWSALELPQTSFRNPKKISILGMHKCDYGTV